MQSPINIMAAVWLLDSEGEPLRQIFTDRLALEDLPFETTLKVQTSGLAPGLYGIAVVAAESLTNTQILNVKIPSVFEVLEAALPEPPPPPPGPVFKFSLGQQVCTSDMVGNITRLPDRPGGRYNVRWTAPPDKAGRSASVPENVLVDCSVTVPEPPEEPEEPEAPRQQFDIGDLVLIGGATATTWIITDSRLRNNRWEYFVDVERGVGGNPGWVRENALSLATPPPPEAPPPIEEPEPAEPPPPDAPAPAFDIGDRVFVGGSRATIWTIEQSEFREGRWRHFVTPLTGSGNPGWVGENLLASA